MNRAGALALISIALMMGCGSSSSAPSSAFDPIEQNPRPAIDRSKPVPSRDEVLRAWQARQDKFKTLKFVWTEQQTRAVGWLPNARFPERDRLAIPALLVERTYSVSKSLTVDGNKMRYSFELDRKEEPDGIRVKPSGNARADGLGVRRNYSYVSVFDGQTGKTSITSLIESPPPAVRPGTTNVDAQNLDTRAILMLVRPLDPVMGHLLVDRAVTNEARIFYKGRSTFMFEERHDPSGWKTLLWVEPERDFLVSRYDVLFEQKLIAQIDIDYVQDAQWGWIPNKWQVTEMLADASRRVVAEATVSSYTINQPIAAGEFQ
jgi:hypothetical protein